MARRSSLKSFGKRFSPFDTAGSFVSADDIKNAPSIIAKTVQLMMDRFLEHMRAEQLAATSDEKLAWINKCNEQFYREGALLKRCLRDLMVALGDDPSDHSKFIAINAFAVGMMSHLPFVRLLEDDVVVGAEKKTLAKEMGRNREESKFDPTRKQLLQWMKDAKRRYPSLNQAEICSKVVEMRGLSVGYESVRKALQRLKIRAPDYSKNSSTRI